MQRKQVFNNVNLMRMILKHSNLKAQLKFARTSHGMHKKVNHCFGSETEYSAALDYLCKFSYYTCLDLDSPELLTKLLKEYDSFDYSLKDKKEKHQKQYLMIRYLLNNSHTTTAAVTAGFCTALANLSFSVTKKEGKITLEDLLETKKVELNPADNALVLKSLVEFLKFSFSPNCSSVPNQIVKLLKEKCPSFNFEPAIQVVLAKCNSFSHFVSAIKFLETYTTLNFSEMAEAKAHQTATPLIRCLVMARKQLQTALITSTENVTQIQVLSKFIEAIEKFTSDSYCYSVYGQFQSLLDNPALHEFHELLKEEYNNRQQAHRLTVCR